MRMRSAKWVVLGVVLAAAWGMGAASATMYTFTFEGSYALFDGPVSDLGGGDDPGGEEDPGGGGGPDDPPPPEEKGALANDDSVTLNLCIDVTGMQYWNEWDGLTLLEHIDALGTVVGWQAITWEGTFDYWAVDFLSGYGSSINSAEAVVAYTEPAPGLKLPESGTANAEVWGYDDDAALGYRSGVAAWLDVEYDEAQGAGLATGFMGDFWEYCAGAAGSSSNNYSGYEFSGQLTNWQEGCSLPGVPEPASMTLLVSLGLGALAARKLRKRS